MVYPRVHYNIQAWGTYVWLCHLLHNLLAAMYLNMQASIRQVALGCSLQEPDRVLPTCEICTQDFILQ